MLSCPYCGSVAVEEEYEKTTPGGAHVRVRIRRCLAIRKGLSRSTLYRNPNAPSQKLCKRVDILSEEPL